MIRKRMVKGKQNKDSSKDIFNTSLITINNCEMKFAY